MTRKQIMFSLACCILFFTPIPSYSQNTIPGIKQVRHNQENNSVAFALTVKRFFSTIDSEKEWLRSTILKCSIDDELIFEKTNSDKEGYVHYRYKQYYKNYPVEFGRYYLHTKNGIVESVNGEFYPGIDVVSINFLSRENAFTKALEIFNSNTLKSDHIHSAEKMKASGEMVILPLNNQYHLAWKFDLYSEVPLKRVYLYIDADNGKKLLELNRIHTSDKPATAVTMYNGTRTITVDSVSANVFRLRESGRAINTKNLQHGSNYGSAVDFTDADNFWNNTANDDHAATDAHLGSEKTYDFYLNSFGRNSYDDAGASINSYVHYSTNYVNAFWDGTQMTYGDGNGSTYFPLTCMDIVGHEITHAVTEHSAGLIYSAESGALNESYSDVMGVTIDFYANPTTANWLEGDQCSSTLTPFRSLANPNLYSCPDTYLGDFWDLGQEVHTNSGVMNYWYYLLVNGGSGTNDNGDNFSISGIGLIKAAAIAYRSLDVYLTPNSDYDDARTYAIQSAIDLYGPCSHEVIQTTNAWYAVGVGGLFNNAVIAAFTASANYLCATPASISFINTSTNGLSYTWYFGDGTTSTATNPVHLYSDTGIYNVMLIVNGSAACGNTDTLLLSSFITVTNSGAPVTPSCAPATQSFCCDAGIKNVSFVSINSTSLNASEGYKDFSCNYLASLVAGDPYPISITTGSSTENVKAWIDYNNDGAFSAIEEVFASNNHLIQHSGYIHTSSLAVTGTPLRMRITDDVSSVAIPNACTQPLRGQVEDYTVTFTANALPPVCDFIATDTIVTAGISVQFYDLSVHAPTAWQWSFPGAVNPGSILRNPTAVYSAPGTYAVSLHISNSFGQDSITKTAYITVNVEYNLCSTTGTITQPAGNIYDSGGPAGNYTNGESCSLLLSPSCSDSIKLFFTSFSSESCCDRLYVYDGTDVTGILLLTAGGSTIPQPVTAQSGSMFIRWTTDGSVVSSGFAANFITYGYNDTTAVAADFSISDATPAFATPVQFTDASSGSPKVWNWTFGDGSTSTLRNPQHAYTIPGTYTVKLISSNCTVIDSIEKLLVVQMPPVLTIAPDTFELNTTCGDTASGFFTIYNSGTGDLSYSFNSQSGTDTMNILAFTFGADMGTEYPNTVNAINTYYPLNTIQATTTTLAATLQAELVGKDILLFPEQESGGSTFYALLQPVINSFLADGGTVIACGTNYATNRLSDMGLFSHSTTSSISTGFTLSVDTNNIITSGLTPNIPSHSLITVYEFTNPDVTRLVTYTSGVNYDVVSYRDVGDGRIIYIGSDYYTPDVNFSKIIGHSIAAAKANDSPGYFTPATDTILPNDSSVVSAWLPTSGMVAGIYQGTITINTNDPFNDPVSYPYILNITGSAGIQVSTNCLYYDTVLTTSTTSQQFIISNSGCDTLNVSTGFCCTASFSVSNSVFDVPPYSVDTIDVTFNPASTGVFSDTLILQTNDHPEYICLSGTALPAPQLVTGIDSLHFYLDACADVDSIPFYIYNAGGSNLDYTFTYGGLDTVHILTYPLGADLITEYPNTLAAISAYFSRYTVASTTTPDNSILQSMLTGKNVILFPEDEVNGTPSTAYTGITPAVQSFVSNGGTAIFLGTNYASANTRIFDMGFFTGSFQGNTTTGSLTVNDTSDYLAQGFPLLIPTQNATFYCDITNSDKHEIVSYGTNDVVTYRNYGAGRVIYLGYDFYASDTLTKKLLANSISQLAQGFSSASANIEVIPESGSVSVSDSALIYIHANSNGLSAGDHYGYVLLETNDPLHLSDTIYYTITISAKPCPAFIYTQVNSCSSVVPFTDHSFNNPTSWFWSFGDSTYSAAQNPTHTYLNPGTYTVQLVVCRNGLCDSTSQSITINSNIGPGPAFCIPTTTATCCNYGISQVAFANIQNTSGDATEGNIDFTCSDTTTVYSGVTYSIGVTTHPSQSEAVRVWIDYNNNLIFDAAELVFSSTALGYHTGNITIPVVAVRNAPLRMRIGSERNGYTIASNGCGNLIYGQYEDYTVTIKDLAPVASATYNILNTCSGSVQFNGSSTSLPVTWFWDFGDSTTSTLQNPVHTYSSSGQYTAILTASNSIGSDTTVLNINVNAYVASMSITGIYTVGDTIYFNGTASASSTYMWYFGTGATSSLQNTAYIYSLPGTYIVNMIATGGGCIKSVYDTIVILPVGVEEIAHDYSFTVHPNPFNEAAQLNITTTKRMTFSANITDLSGRIIEILSEEKNLASGNHAFKIRLETPGIYFVNTRFNNEIKSVKIIKTE